MNSSPVVISYLTQSYRENRCLQILGNTVALNSYLGLSALSQNFFFGLYKIWQGRQLFAKTFWTHSEYSLESLNFVALTKPNKHKMTSESFSTTWPNSVFEFFCDSRRILATFAKFCLNSLFAAWSYRFTRHPARARSSSPPSPTQVFWRKKFLQNLFPSPNCFRQISLKRFWY